MGSGDIPDPLFDPQFIQNKNDFQLCKSLDQPLAISRSQYAHSYLAKGKVQRGGKGKGQKGKGKDQPAVGGKGKDQPAVGGKGKHQPAVGGKAGGKSQQFLQMRRGSGSPVLLHTNALKMFQDGTWLFRKGQCISLPQLFHTMGETCTSIDLYKYWHLMRPLACKRPHSWSSPWRQVASLERFDTTGRYGHGP